MLGILCSPELDQCYSCLDACSEEDITLDTASPASEVACYAAWPIQAYIKGFSISNALALTFTSRDDFVVEDFSASRDDFEVEDFSAPRDWCTASPEPLEYVSDITLQISGGTVQSVMVNVDPHRRILCTREAWEREED